MGETNDWNVRPLGPKRHDGLAKYVEFFPEDPNFAQLYVSVCEVVSFRPQDLECHAWRAFTRHLEARPGWEYTKRFGKRPLLDYKHGKDEFVVSAELRANQRMEPTRR